VPKLPNRIRKVTLEKVAKEKLAKQIVKDIDTIELEVWENVESGLSLHICKKTIKLRLNYIIPTRKFLAWSTGLVATMGGVITVLKWLLPILQAYFDHPMP
jgi:hypothetical protein